MTEAERITRALKGRWYGRYGVTLCPAHPNTQTPSLSIVDGEGGRLLLHCHAGCAFLDILDALKCYGLVPGSSAYTPPDIKDIERLRRAEIEQAEKQATRAFKCWQEARPITGTIGEIYFRHRGITAPLPETLRFHPDCWHPSGSRFPAVVALVEGAPRFAVHRTYLRRDGAGKASVEPAKAMLGAVVGGGVILSGADQDSIVCEGIETGLSLASGILTRPATIIAALSTSGMKRLALPDTPGKLTIATDGDDAGRAAGNDLGIRATALGWHVSILPAPNGLDWNDVLMARSKAA